MRLLRWARKYADKGEIDTKEHTVGALAYSITHNQISFCLVKR